MNLKGEKIFCKSLNLFVIKLSNNKIIKNYRIMKNTSFTIILLLCTFQLIQFDSLAQMKKVVIVKQTNHPKHHKNNHVKVIKKSKFRPVKSSVFHPHWAKNKNFNRRWVYFPKYNCYWDNWRNVYFYKEKSKWLYSSTTPAVLIQIELEKEKYYELKDTEDEIDEIYINNETHSSEYNM
jgi:hypothetical protein